MFAGVRTGLLWLAGALLLAHSVVPHVHTAAQHAAATETHWSTSSSHAPDHPLEADLGMHHLENYRVDTPSAVTPQGDTHEDSFFLVVRVGLSTRFPGAPWMQKEPMPAQGTQPYAELFF